MPTTRAIRGYKKTLIITDQNRGETMFLSYGWRVPKRRAAEKHARQEPKYHCFRLNAQLKRQHVTAPVSGRLLSTDLTPRGAALFVNQPLEREEVVTISIDHPRRLVVKGKVIWCGPYTLNMRVLSAESFSYRAHIELIFETAEEREIIRTFVL